VTVNETNELLERLGRGEVAVAGDLHVAYAAYLRVVVRRQMSDRLRARCDSADVVQSVWAHVVRQVASSGWRVGSEPQLRALLAVIARRRVASRARSFARSIPQVDAEGSDCDTLPAIGQPRPSEVAQADELWERMLALCPPEHRAILHLRREGLPLTEVARRTGLHEGSVRRILRQLARDLALRVEPEHLVAVSRSEELG
jgi:RNA polymerase sigma-70 factor (ECF subfamily)